MAGIHAEATEEDVRDMFADYGDIKNIQVTSAVSHLHISHGVQVADLYMGVCVGL